VQHGASFAKSRGRMKVHDVRRNLVPDSWTADGEGALPKLGPCPHDNSCVGCRGTEMAASRFFCVELDDIVEVCWPTLIKSSVHHGGDLLRDGNSASATINALPASAARTCLANVPN